MKRVNTISIVTALAVILLSMFLYLPYSKNDRSDRTIKVGFVYDGDESAPYTYNFIRAQYAVEAEYGDRVEIAVRNNTPNSAGEAALRELVEEGCDLIFTTSFGYGETAKQMAGEYPDVQFCQATCYNSNEAPIYDNYHTFMGHIYEGRYLAGVAAGMKLNQMIEEGVITEEEARIGYVAAYPYAEVISGYTAFLLGVRSVVPYAVMTVKYTNTWTSYTLEKECAEELIAEGCVVISQHSDTTGPAVACENADLPYPVYHVGYNQSMQDVAPTTSLLSTRINWTPYILSAVEAVLQEEEIEKHVDATIHGRDAGAGFEKDWVQVVDVNDLIAVEGTDVVITNAIRDFEHGKIQVFKGNYVGVDPFDETDTYDLSNGYMENETTSAPMFHYVLKDVITVE